MKMKKAWIILFAIVIPALLLLSGCDSRTGNEVNYEITSINISPRLLYADNDSSTNSAITVTVEDSEGYPAVGVAVDFNTDLGYLQGKVFTSDTGVASTTYNDNGRVGIAHITASINESNIVDSVEVKSNPHFTIDRVTISDTLIYADHGITSSSIEVLIKDQDGFAATGESVWFQADFGNIITHVSTDSSGIATTTFWDDGNYTGPVTISIFCGLAYTTRTITVANQPPVTELHLDVVSAEITINTVRTIEATALNVAGPVPNGTLITFQTVMGYFQTSQTDVTYLGKTVTISTSNGAARAFLNSGTQAGANTVTAVINVDNTGNTLEDSSVMSVLPGRPTQMSLIPRNEDGVPTTVTSVGSGENLYIWAYVRDNYGNPVTTDYVVSYTTTLGNILSPVSITEGGIAVSTFSAGINAGVAQITAEVDSAFATSAVTVMSDEVNSIQFVNQNQVSIDVQGTGGNESAELAVNLYDMNGNLIDYPVQVWFKFLERPEGAYPEGSNINNVVYNTVDNQPNTVDSTYTMSSNGAAVVSVNSGTQSGIIKIEAWCRTTTGIKKSSAKPNIVVQSGPPHECEFTIGGGDDGEDMGGGIWRVQVGAIITDQWGNPVGDGTAVYYSLPDNPDYASVESADAYVGNENANGDTLAGTAFTNIIYDGTYTNETITVNVDVGVVDFDGDLVLPLQNGEITMICVPAHLDWTEDNATVETLFTQCRIHVRDAQNNPINKQRIIFTCSLGFPTDEGENGIHPIESDIDPYYLQLYDFTEINEESPTDDHDGYTGPYDGAMGRLYKDVGYFKYECLPPIPAPPGMSTGTITATIFGTSRSSNQTITLFRYFD
ncbi:MAG: hypothetical protein K9N06_11105 [Candidatus Cloacimonetes bacterium]|nr:hypothetical protein [Candidatus Cloacimonadota bacterium]